MSDETKATGPVEEPNPNPAPVEGDGGSAPVEEQPKSDLEPQEPFRSFKTESDFKAFKTTLMEEPSRKIQRLEQKLQAKETEDERTQREANEAQEREREQYKESAKLMGALIAHGLSDQAAETWAEIAHSKELTGDTKDVITQLEQFGLSVRSITNGQAPLGPGQGGNTPQPKYAFDAEGLAQAAEEMTPEEFKEFRDEHREEIRKAQGLTKRRIGGAFTGRLPVT